MTKAIVAGVGMLPFGRHRDRSDLGVESVLAALSDAGLVWHDVQLMYCGVVGSGMTPGTGVGKLSQSFGGSSVRPGSPEAREANIRRMQGIMPRAGYFAMRTSRRMHDFGSTFEQFALVSVKNHKHASHNRSPSSRTNSPSRRSRTPA